MKKLLTLTLALLMIASLSVNAFAAEEHEATNNGTTPTSIEVKAKYTGGVETPNVISVDISWGAMEFTYSVSGQKNWNASNHSYTDNSTAKWSASGNTVAVTNHSNVGVKVDFAYNQVNTGVTGTFTVASKTLAAGVVGQYASADSVVSTLGLSGTFDASVTDFTQVGSITVTIAEQK